MSSTWRWRGWPIAVLIVAAACGDDSTGPTGGAGGQVVFPPPLGPLPATTPTETDRFTTSGTCNQCHLAGGEPVMHDPQTNADLSPGYTWRTSMMALAARDPYYLAVFSEELAGAQDPAPVDATCTRCHAPAGSEELRTSGGHLRFDDLVSGSTPAANLGRDGVTCTLCHQIADKNLGDLASFTGKFEVGFDRTLYGPYQGPQIGPMQLIVDYTPTYSEHIGTSELCATCHTVITPITEAGKHVGDFLEQAPYLEWLNSSYAGATPCQTCHLPRVDSIGAPISTPIATYPDALASRDPFGVHSFEGANVYMTTILSRNVEWSGSGLASSDLDAAAARSARHLQTAAELTILDPTIDAGGAAVPVEVTNHTGHKLPTGFPGKRLWLHVRAEDSGGAIVFESGKWNDGGWIVDGSGAPLDQKGVTLPHRDAVSNASEVAIWEAIAAGADGKPTFLPLSAVGYAKDDRILPDGWSDAGPWTKWTRSVSVAGDSTFVPGSDSVTYRLPPSAVRMTVDLVYQSVSPAAIDHVASVPTPAAVRFAEMASELPPVPVVIASAERAW